jgi:hypothetical protein
MPRVVVEHLDRLAQHRGLQGIDLAQIQHVALHDAPARDTLVLDDAPIIVRLAVFLALGLPQKHDEANLDTRICCREQGRSSLQPISAVVAQYLPCYQMLTVLRHPKIAISPRESANMG